MRPRLFVVMLIGLALGGLAAWVISGNVRFTAAPTTQVTGKALIGGPFSLIDHTGKRVTEADFRGRKMLVFFGFTSCPDICPTGLQAMTTALESLGAKADAVTPVFISVDPERDTPKALADYVKSFHPRLVALTGTTAEVAAAAKTYRVYFKKVDDGKTAGAYSVDHSSFLYLMDERGEFIRHFNHPVDAAKLAAELAKSL